MINTLIIDNQKSSITTLKNYVTKCEELDLKLATSNIFTAINYVKVNKIDLVFLDLQVPLPTGLDFIESLKSYDQRSPYFVITALNDQYAVTGFEYGAIDYLLKPYSFGRFRKSIDRVVQRYMIEYAKKRDYLIIDSGRAKNKIFFDDILFLESFPKNSVTVYLEEHEVVARMSLNTIMEKLPKDRFVRVSSSYIVSVNKVTSLANNHLVLSYDEKNRIPISSRNKDKVLRKLGLIENCN